MKLKPNVYFIDGQNSLSRLVWTKSYTVENIIVPTMASNSTLWWREYILLIKMIVNMHMLDNLHASVVTGIQIPAQIIFDLTCIRNQWYIDSI